MAAWLKGVQLLLQSHDGNGEDLYLLLQGDDSTASFQLVLVNTQQLQQLIPPLHDRLLLHPVPLLLELTLMAFKSLNLSCLARMSVEMASCFLTTGPYMLQVRPISWIRLNSDHLISPLSTTTSSQPCTPAAPTSPASASPPSKPTQQGTPASQTAPKLDQYHVISDLLEGHIWSLPELSC